MAFRISRGIWQFKKADGTYESKYKLATDGRLVETDALGNEVSTFGSTASWDTVTGKPSTFTPSAHTHDDRYYTETEINTLLAGKQAAGSYAAASHTHDDRYLVKGGSWYGVNLPGSRWGGYSVNGGEIVFGRDLPNNGQMGVLIDGAYLAGENNGFWSLNSTNDWSARRGMYYDGTYLNLTTNTPTTRVSSLLSDGTVTMASISGTDQMVENTYGAYLHLGGWGVGRTDASAVLVNTAYRADYATSLFDMNISRFTNNSGYLTNGSSEIITYIYRIHASDGTSPDNFGYSNRYQTFNYGVSSGITGPLLTFGGLGEGYPMQITGAYSGGGNAFAVRTRNGDTGVWNSWRTLITDGNIGSQSVNYAASAGAVAWSNVSGKPSTFTPSSHTHAISDVTGLQGALDGKQVAGSYAAASHTHTIANVTDLQAALDGKQVAGSYAASSHTHTIANVTGLQTALDGKQAAGSYAAASHEHDRTFITDSRGAARLPSYYDDRYAQWDFQNTTDTGAGGDSWHGLLTVAKWSVYDGSHRQEQLAFTGDDLKRRTASSDTAWGAWKTILDSTNFSSWAQPRGDYAASSHTHTPSQVGLGNVSNAAQVTTANNSSLNTDSRNTRGVTRMYRRDDNSDFSVQTNWTGSHWHVRGYNGDTFHAEARVGYSDSSGTSSNFNNGNWYSTTNNLYCTNSGVINYRIHSNGGTSVFDIYGGTSGFEYSIRHRVTSMPVFRYYFDESQYSGNHWINVDPYANDNGWGASPTQYALAVDGVTATRGFEDFSDRRSKSAIVEISGAIEKVCAISGYTYWKQKSDVREAGVIAQDVLAAFPEASGGNEDAYTVKPSALIGLLMKAVKEQQAIIDDLTTRIQTLENK